MVAERCVIAIQLSFHSRVTMATAEEQRTQAVTLQGLGVPIADSSDDDQPNGTPTPTMGQPQQQPNGTPTPNLRDKRDDW